MIQHVSVDAADCFKVLRNGFDDLFGVIVLPESQNGPAMLSQNLVHAAVPCRLLLILSRHQSVLDLVWCRELGSRARSSRLGTRRAGDGSRRCRRVNFWSGKGLRLTR